MTVTDTEPVGRLAPLGPRAAGTRRAVRTGRRRRHGPGMRLLLGVGGTLVFLAVLELVARSGVIVDQKYLPPVSSVLVRAVQLAGDGTFRGDVGATMQAWALALLVAMVIGIPAGVLLATSRISYAVSSSLIAAVRPIPAVALIPIALLVWGNGTSMKVGLAVFGILWPILFNTMYGVHDVDPVARETARSYGIRRVHVLWRVVLPSAAPFILTGIRIAASLALVIIVSTELFAGASTGIGAFVLLASSGGADTATVMAGAVWAGFLGVVINALLIKVDDRYFRWSRRGETA